MYMVYSKTVCDQWKPSGPKHNERINGRPLVSWESNVSAAICILNIFLQLCTCSVRTYVVRIAVYIYIYVYIYVYIYINYICMYICIIYICMYRLWSAVSLSYHSLQGGRNAFLLCALYNHLAVAEYLAPKMEGHLFDSDDDGHTALHLAAYFGLFSMVQYLVRSCGFDVKARDKVDTFVWLTITWMSACVSNAS